MEIKLDGNDWQLLHLMPTEWMWRQVWKEDWDPQRMTVAGEWIRGTVPGDVIADAWDAKLIADPYVDMQSRAAEWTSERDWLYRKQFSIPAEFQGKTIRLHFDGVDSNCTIFLNGERIGTHENMFVPFDFDVTERLRYDQPNTLLVIVDHMPPVEAVQGQIGWTSRARVWKSRFTYNWDWCTRLVPLGIWQSVRVIATDDLFLTDVWVRPQVYELTATVEVRASVHASKANVTSGRVRLQMSDPQGQPIGQAQEAEVQVTSQEGNYVFMVDIANPQLWYPNGMGEQPLYQARVEVLSASGEVTDARQVAFGIRTIRAISNVGASTTALPYTIEVNGRRMYVKGWNWAPIDNLYGRPQLDRYERLLTLAHHAHCNLLRVWGGGLLEREEFYNLCDQLGILVWQEFHQSSSGIDNRPPADEEYQAYIEQLARQMIPLRRNHAALAIWCGGNELMDDSTVPLSDTHPALARLKAIVQELDPERLWLPTSASGPVEGSDPKLNGTGQMHDVHGPWQYLGPREQYRFFNAIDPLYHSEFGAEGAANLYTLKRFISPKYHFPPDATNPAWVHHGSWWLHREKLEAMFGKFEDVATFVRASQWMQAEGLRYVIEADRRRKWHTSGSSPWQLNEAFPNASCTNVVDFVGLTKPAYWWVRRGYEPTHISARYESITFKPQDEWRAEFWANNSLSAIEGCKWSAQLMDLQGQIVLSTGGALDLPDDGAIRVGEIIQTLPAEPGVFILFLTLTDAGGKLLSRNEYMFSTFDPPFQAMLNGPAPVLKVTKQRGVVSVTNESTTPALFVQFDPAKGQWLTLEDDYFCLLPGETRTVRATGKGTVIVHAWNSQSSLIRLS